MATADNNDFRNARAFFLESLSRRLVGPDKGEHEVLEDKLPTENYITGVLAPRNAHFDPAEDDGLTVGGEDEEGTSDLGVSAALSNSFRPSALGISCVIDTKAKIILCTVKAARYRRLSDEIINPTGTVISEEGEEVAPMELSEEDSGNEQSTHKDKTRVRYRFQRVPIYPDTFPIALSESKGVKDIPESNLRISWIIRDADWLENAKILTVTVINLDEERPGENLNPEKFLFQVAIRLDGTEDMRRPFLPRRIAARDHPDPDALTMELLYRDHPAFASGHGCAASWETGRSDRAGWIESCTLPLFEVPMIEASGREGRDLQMRWLAQSSTQELKDELDLFIGEYEQWIEAQDSESVRIQDYLKVTAERNIVLCRETLARMKRGLALLVSSDEVLTAFRLMNEAMRVQRLDGKDSCPEEDEPRWYPFQLAFILQCIPGACSEDPSDEPVQLLWFPTGGGKTEAYLGVAAFTICLRRLRGKGALESAGVTVLMRYTLRLLTIQQFQRAASLICALERMRRENVATLGESEISIGLWVGMSSTPNWLRDAFAQLRDPESSNSSPVQLGRCPACGSKLDYSDYRPSDDRKSLVISCGSDSCTFRDHLPVYVVDEEIYRRCPTLMIGTVDKFARMPWEERCRSIFGMVSSWCPEHGFSTTQTCVAGRSCKYVVQTKPLSPPSLVIQDELHLISGPLGTMVGVYEALIDFICNQRGRIPQVIGSSATVRRSEEQCYNLYGRDVAIFPPRALRADDTFYSRPIPLDRVPGRVYCGVLPTGFSMKTALIRIYGSILTDAEFSDNIPPIGTPEGNDLRDPYWTVISYFNSLRELGGAVRLIEDDVPAYRESLVDKETLRPTLDYQELTSRKKGYEIPAILQDLEKSLRENEPDAVYDIVFATNMISVGVDVKRLGVMVVNGQPKSTAEYIQATSRIGRHYPGLVISLYNWARPRDRSHYEDFIDYHATFYRHVEVNSVTPYTMPAIQRGISALLVGAVRILEQDMASDNSAHRFRPDLSVVKNLRTFLSERLNDPRRPDNPVAILNRLFDQAIDHWMELARLTSGKLNYSKGKTTLLVSFEDSGGEESVGMPTLNSLRAVEPSTGLQLTGRGVIR